MSAIIAKPLSCTYYVPSDSRVHGRAACLWVLSTSMLSGRLPQGKCNHSIILEVFNFLWDMSLVFIPCAIVK